jgi:hypothetical protein
MKTQILFLLFVISSLFGYSQSTYYPLIDTGKTWHVIEAAFPSPTLTFTYKCDGDTSVNGDIYKFLYMSGEEFPENWTKIGYIRETADHMVYYSVILENDPGYFDPLLIYDFTVDVNDTLNINSFLGSGYGSFEVEIIIAEIDSILIADNYRKRIKYSCENYEENFWIEGIGSNNGLLGAGFYCYIVCPMLELLCVKEQSEIIYQHEYFEECYIVGTNEYKSLPGKFIIYPNPANDYILIVPKSADNLNVIFKLYNSYGQEILKKEMDQYSLKKVSFIDMAPGRHFYTISDTKHIIQSGKILIH